MRTKESEDVMHIDCDTCEVRGLACGDCVVTYLLGSVPEGVGGVEFDSEERAALEVLAASGLVPPLRLVTPLRADPHAHQQQGDAAQSKGDSMMSAG
jgi:hypothetical protein